MMRSLPRVWIPALLLAAGASGQDGPTTSSAPLDTVEVHGRNEKLGKEVQNFVSTVTQLDGELVSSWVMPLCPKVLAEDPSHAEYIRQRLMEVAAEVPLDADTDGDCRANLFVILTSTPEEFVAEWKRRDPGMFIWRPRRGVTRSPETLPVRTWHNVALEPADGEVTIAAGGDTASLGSRIPGGAPKYKASSSRVRSNVSENLQSALVLVDTKKAAGVTLRQLADYIALVSYSKIDLTADFGDTNSILRLFDSDDSAVRPGSLTMWDLAFLRGLYRQSFEAVQQRSAIATRMVRDLVENAPTAPPP
jgi:hypothetical protein